MVGNLGLSESQLTSQFGTLAGLNPLLGGLQGTTETDIGKDVALQAGFEGNAASVRGKNSHRGVGADIAIEKYFMPGEGGFAASGV